jgi:hypothetical protein
MLCASLAGCAAVSSLTGKFVAGTQSAATDVNTLAALAQDPNVVAAGKNLQAFGTAVVCDVASVSALVQYGATQVKATKTVDGSTIVNVTTAKICAAVGGSSFQIPTN